jgi:hypothetical protein
LLCSLPLAACHSHTLGIVQICLGINLFWYKFYSACPDMPNRINSIRRYSRSILCLFMYKFRYKLFIAILVTSQYVFTSESYFTFNSNNLLLSIEESYKNEYFSIISLVTTCTIQMIFLYIFPFLFPNFWRNFSLLVIHFHDA